MSFKAELEEKTKYYTRKGEKRKIQGSRLVEYVQANVYRWMSKYKYPEVEE